MDVDAQAKRQKTIKKLKTHLITTGLTLALILFSVISKKAKTRNNHNTGKPVIVNTKNK
jgi:hypothetical protein